VVDHYDFEASRIQPGEAHENGVAEKANDLLKTALRQALILRGSRDFPTVEDYLRFARTVVDERFHRHRVDELAHERTALKPLPEHRLPEYTKVDVVVRRWSTVHVAKRVYSVPSRLIGHALEARVHPDVVEIWLGNALLETMPRLRGAEQHRIDYRHVIWSLVRKPGAFAAYRYREDLFPTLTFRRAYEGAGKSDAWRRLWHTFEARNDEFLPRYHQRSNVESTFSMVKRKFGASVRAKVFPAQVNEVLLKCLCHNLSVLVHAIHDLGIEPSFWARLETA
jgi:hypothetical protein